MLFPQLRRWGHLTVHQALRPRAIPGRMNSNSAKTATWTRRNASNDAEERLIAVGDRKRKRYCISSDASPLRNAADSGVGLRDEGFPQVHVGSCRLR
jgi:hypothetical protein